MSTMRSALLASCLAAISIAACGGGSDDASTTGDESSAFIAFTSDFQGFRSWESFHTDNGTAEGATHIAGPRTEYLNKRPPHGSTTFPVGTIIVKELELGSLENRIVFALVKRGGGYDSEGAPGWEWFELQNLPDGSVGRIVWRGVGPPIGETYGGDPNGCSSCHAAAKDNDFVPSPALQLSQF